MNAINSIPVPIRFVFVAYLLVSIGCAFGLESFCQDEGFYALAAKHVSQGMRPYRDFLYAQMPFLPYVYAAWFRVFGASIEAGRALSVLLSVVGTGFLMASCRRLAGDMAAVVAGLLMLASCYTWADLAAIKTQALCHALASASIYAVVRTAETPRLLGYATAMALMSLAFLTRLTFLVPLVGLWAYVAWNLRAKPLHAVGLIALNAVLLLASIRWFWADGNLAFGTYVLHRDFLGAEPWTWTRLRWTIKGSIGNQMVVLFLFLFAAIRFLRSPADGRLAAQPALLAWLLFSYVGSTLLHWSTVQNYPTHQTPITSFGIVFAIAVLKPILDSVSSQGRGAAFAAFLLACGLASPFSEMSVIDSLQAKDGGLTGISEGVRILSDNVVPGSRLLTFNDELAVNGGYDVVRGCDAYQFGYVPGMADEAAAKFHTLNLNGLREAIESPSTAAIAVNDRDFAIMAAGNSDLAKELKAAIDKHYHNVGVVKRYGQFGLDLFIFKRLPGDTLP
jgi:hypothetical protein